MASPDNNSPEPDRSRKMHSTMPELRFVEVDEFGHALTAKDEYARRSHIRRAISRTKKERPLWDRLKFVDQNEASKRKATRNQKVTKSPTPQPRRSDLSTGATADTTTSPDTVLAASPKRPSPTLGLPLVISHPFTYQASRSVDIPSSRLDQLFKSDAFRSASEPLFDGTHVDSILNMPAVFPDCAEEPVFLNAMVYAAVQMHNRGATSTEGLLLKGKTIKLLNDKFSRPDQGLSPATVGAIMLLHTVAYKFSDPNDHFAHASGLMKAVSLCIKRDINLTAAAKRAIFWIDLFASILIGSRRQLSHFTLPALQCWRREQLPSPALSLPIGFVRHRSLLPDQLLECISDTYELQSLLRRDAITRLPLQAKYHQLDTMQASIESRLTFQQQACEMYGPVAEAVRLGIFIVCYCSWMETWNSSLVPCHVAEKLMMLLEPVVTLADKELYAAWADRVDLLLWLLFVISNVAILDQGHVKDLQRRTVSLLRAAQESACSWVSAGIIEPQTLQNALHGFVCCNGWQEQRYGMDAWVELELAINTAAVSVDICMEWDDIGLV